MPRLLRLACALVAACLLAACGVKVTSTTTIDKNIAGTRIFTFAVSKNDLSSSDVKKTPAEIDAVIRQHLPSILTYSGMADDGSTISGSFTMGFSSADDYAQKIDTLRSLAGLSEDSYYGEPEMKYYDTPLKKGLSINEQFTDVELMGWLADALVYEHVIEEHNRNSIFDNSGSPKPTVVFEGNTYPSEKGNRLVVKQIKDDTFAHVEVYTSMKPENQGETVVIYHSDSGLPDHQVKALEEFLKDRMPEGAEKLTPLHQGEYMIRFMPKDMDDLSAKLKKLLDDDSVSIKLDVAPNGDSITERIYQLTGTIGCRGVCQSTDDADDERARWYFVYDQENMTPEGNSYGDPDFSGVIPDWTGSSAGDGKKVDLSFASKLVFEPWTVTVERSFMGGYDVTFEYPVKTEELKNFDLDLEKLFDPGDAGDITVEERDDTTVAVVTLSGSNAEEISERLAGYRTGGEIREDDQGGALWSKKTMISIDLPMFYDSDTPSGSTLVVRPSVLHSLEEEPGAVVKTDGKDLIYTDAGATLVMDHGPTLFSLIILGVIALTIIGLIVLAIVLRKRAKRRMAAGGMTPAGMSPEAMASAVPYSGDSADFAQGYEPAPTGEAAQYAQTPTPEGYQPYPAQDSSPAYSPQPYPTPGGYEAAPSGDGYGDGYGQNGAYYPQGAAQYGQPSADMQGTADYAQPADMVADTQPAAGYVQSAPEYAPPAPESAAEGASEGDPESTSDDRLAHGAAGPEDFGTTPPPPPPAPTV
ncbi:hypothetical protein [Trueperella sp. LYQ143]|uniref:hypothetical protein n=1 Tax=Trueperella sp. LYQ143 TaxID=3391059 RepID=UPI003982F839